jgi:hypothetical protein
MERPHRLVPVALIVLSLCLGLFVVVMFFVPSLVRQLPWAGVLAGVLAVLQALNLRGAAPAVRWTLALTGAAAAVFMLVLALR